MSRTGDLKSELINRAYRELRISGLTKIPTPFELTSALDTLENMAEEYRARNICTSYNFEDEPDLNSPHNLERKYWNAYSLGLAKELLSTFGKGTSDKIDPQLLYRQRAAYSFLVSSTAQIRQVQPSQRMPIGSGSQRFGHRYRSFYPEIDQAPIGCATYRMVIGEVDDLVEHYDAYLNDGETISSFTISADTGLTLGSSSNTDTDISYRVTATGTSETASYNFLQVTITVTTSDSRKNIRTINFELRSE